MTTATSLQAISEAIRRYYTETLYLRHVISYTTFFRVVDLRSVDVISKRLIYYGYTSCRPNMSSTSGFTIDLSGLSTAINSILNVLVQYLPIIVTVGVIIGVIYYITGGFSGIVNAITGIFGGT